MYVVPVASETLRTIIVNPVVDTVVIATAYLGEDVLAVTAGITENLLVGNVTVTAVSCVLTASAVPAAVVVLFAAIAKGTPVAERLPLIVVVVPVLPIVTPEAVAPKETVPAVPAAVPTSRTRLPLFPEVVVFPVLSVIAEEFPPVTAEVLISPVLVKTTPGNPTARLMVLPITGLPMFVVTVRLPDAFVLMFTVLPVTVVVPFPILRVPVVKPSAIPTVPVVTLPNNSAVVVDEEAALIILIVGLVKVFDHAGVFPAPCDTSI